MNSRSAPLNAQAPSLIPECQGSGAHEASAMIDSWKSQPGVPRPPGSSQPGSQSYSPLSPQAVLRQGGSPPA